MSKTTSNVDIHIAYIGGGSRGWAHILMNDLAQCPDLHGEVRLFDIDLPAAKLNEVFGNWIQQQQGVQSPWRYRAVDTLAESLKGADFVFLSIQPGPLEMMAHEIAVAEKFGLFFPVGDTTGAPGLMRGLRSARTYARFARSIAEHCPDAWVINYTNPMSICTRTLTKVVPELKVFGCCHEVFGTQRLLANLAKGYFKLPETPERDEIGINVLGINHFTWIDQAAFNGHNLLPIVTEHIQKPKVLRPYTQKEVEAARNWFHDANQIKFALYQRFGIMAAAGDRHLSEFVPGFTRSPEELFRWGIIRTPVSWRMDRVKVATKMIENYLSGQQDWHFRDSGEEMVHQLRALLGLGDFVTNVNFANQGQIVNLPSDVVVETNALFSRDRVQPLAAGRLPDGVQNLVSRHITNQEMMITAALTEDRDLAFQAIFNDPTHHLPLDQVWQMFEELDWDQNIAFEK
jgi:alpha-galactosidase